MANPEHVQILEQGIEAWNAWREQYSDISPNLSEANFEGEDFRGANLSNAYLNLAFLNGADLRGANLYRACLNGAFLNGADLRGAKLSSADLTYAQLDEAHLNRAFLDGAYFNMTTLTGADVSEAHLSETIFGQANLTDVVGLETCKHSGPSILDHHTLAIAWPLPLAFLRGCGLPEALIEYLPSILGKPFQFYSCFISYSSVDEDFCRRLHGRLQDAGLRVWFAPHDIKGGRKIHEQIDQAIRVYDKLLLVLSPYSMQSPWVEFEIRRARKREVAEKRRVLFPVRLVDFETIKAWECFDADTGKDLATEIREYYIPDFTAWKDHDAFEAAVGRLLRDLKDPERKPDSTT